MNSKKKKQITTPVFDFVEQYYKKNSARFHMPGHKGKEILGCEGIDITEIDGADVLSESQGILGESQNYAREIFGTGATYYSTEGSSLSIKAMLMVAMFAWQERQGDGLDKHCKPWILAARNVHRAMVDACALLDLDVEFLPCRKQKGICSVFVEAQQVKEYLCDCQKLPIGLYLTSPDYLGAQCDIKSIAGVCHEFQVPLLVDNAHGSYLAFLKESQHPIHLGADICCDSAHKTLPVLTGGGYLHLSQKMAGVYSPYVRKAFAVFASTSPSYLILQSLDLCNRYLGEGYQERLADCIEKIEQIRSEMIEKGIVVLKSEPLKIVLDTGTNGYTGYEIADEMRNSVWNMDETVINGIECEFADYQYLVLMFTPENKEEDFLSLKNWLQYTVLQKKREGLKSLNSFSEKIPQRAMSIRQAVFSASEEVVVEEAMGRIIAQETISCPPAIPIGISGEVINREMTEVFQTYGIEKISVVACQK